jgi:hypothetical protein
MKDLYYILGTDRNCTPAELNAAYHKLAQKFQPGNSEHDDFIDSHFREITEAYQILSVPSSRLKYDKAYKKNYQRRLYYFKIRYLNVIAAITLVAFTALFGYYVVVSINGSKKTKKALQPQAVVIHKAKKHKKRTGVKSVPLFVNKIPVIKTDTVAAKKVATEPVKIEKSISTPIVTPALIHNIAKQTEIVNTAYLQANVTGVVSLHQLASYRSDVVYNIPNHAKVQILEKGTSFYKIKYDDKTGYVPNWTVVNP